MFRCFDAPCDMFEKKRELASAVVSSQCFRMLQAPCWSCFERKWQVFPSRSFVNEDGPQLPWHGHVGMTHVFPAGCILNLKDEHLYIQNSSWVNSISNVKSGFFSRFYSHFFTMDYPLKNPNFFVLKLCPGTSHHAWFLTVSRSPRSESRALPGGAETLRIS